MCPFYRTLNGVLVVILHHFVLFVTSYSVIELLIISKFQFSLENCLNHASHLFLQLGVFHRSCKSHLALSTSQWIQIMVQQSKDHDTTIDTYVRSSDV